VCWDGGIGNAEEEMNTFDAIMAYTKRNKILNGSRLQNLLQSTLNEYFICFST
jgi:hypothetical protein